MVTWAFHSKGYSKWIIVTCDRCHLESQRDGIMDFKHCGGKVEPCPSKIVKQYMEWRGSGPVEAPAHATTLKW